MSHRIRPGVFLVFLLTGMTAAAFADTSGVAFPDQVSNIRHSRRCLNRAATLAEIFAAAIPGCLSHTDVSPAHPTLTETGAARSESSPLIAGDAFPRSLGAAKRPHFGRFSARRE